MTASELPDTPELIERIKREMDRAHEEWERDCAARGRGSGKAATQALVRRVWEMGFGYARVYPRAHGLGSDGESIAEKRLAARGASPWTWDQRTEHSTLKEFQFDVSWTAYTGEYEGNDGVPGFQRLVLALESEFGGIWDVLYDFDKLLSARADLRVMVWDSNVAPEAFDQLPRRLDAAIGGDEGCWLLSGWGRDGFEHVEYHNGQRLG